MDELEVKTKRIIKYSAIVLVTIPFLYICFNIGIAIGLYNSGSSIDSKLSVLAAFGDSINPAIALIAAVLVGLGLYYTVKDFKLARREFERASDEMNKGNELANIQYNESVDEKRGDLAKYRLDKIHDELTNYEFLEYYDLFISFQCSASLEEKLFKIASLSTLKEVLKLVTSRNKTQLLLNIKSLEIGNRYANKRVMEAEFENFEWVLPEDSTENLEEIGFLINSYFESLLRLEVLTSETEARTYALTHRRLFKQIRLFLDTNVYFSDYSMEDDCILNLMRKVSGAMILTDDSMNGLHQIRSSKIL